MDNSKTMYDQVVALYEKAISSLHAKNLIIYLAFADFEEQQMRASSAHDIYKKFLSQEDVDPTLVNIGFVLPKKIDYLFDAHIFSCQFL